ncbi:guanine deaminase [Aliiroseovarius sp. Z3]|uniref:guanine deaminase n=1 Tax=Aliiroseovarius sp. Z3 TaxID=2811402 RepID=UPI0023B33502|nr:guanine deaminase [Aliiroseovarius sp. Z3]MDE9451200.1 guanine deaminase [Aliiroseovarius sp. Z3]
MQLLLGQTVRFTADPFKTPLPESTIYERRGAVAINGDKIADVGPADDLRQKYPQAEVTEYGDALITPGFVDTHAHYPQTAIIASWGKRLIDWLNSYTFPEESRFGDPAHAAEIAETYFDLVTASGTTTTVSYCTIHPESVDAYFTAAAKRGLRVLGGKTCMDRNAPDTLQDTVQSAYDDSKMLLERWHGQDRLSYVITPRFAPTSTPDQLAALGALWAEHPEVLMQTHISEQHEEIAWVADLFPEARDYLDVYERFGLLGSGALLGHAIHLTDRERDRIREVEASLIHCPTSNMFIGSGLFDMAGLMDQGHRIGLATDTGGGSSFSMLRTMAAAYEVAQLRGHPLHPAQLWWLATEGSARALRMDDRIGTLEAGTEADLAVIDLASTQAIAQRAARAEDIWQAIFPTIMMGDDRAIKAVWANGACLKS